MPFDHDLFKKIMERTASDNENEARECIRKATKMMRDAGITWTQIIDWARMGKARSQARPTGVTLDAYRDDVVDILATLMRGVGAGLGESLKVNPAGKRKGKKPKENPS
jgi:hypothetical protein